MNGPRPYSREELLRALRHFADASDSVYDDYWPDRERLHVFMRIVTGALLMTMSERVSDREKID